MTLRILTVAAVLAISTSFANAQPSQAQGGAATGPTSNSQNSENGVPSSVGTGVTTGSTAPVLTDPNPISRQTGAPVPNAAISRPPGDAAAPAGR